MIAAMGDALRETERAAPVDPSAPFPGDLDRAAARASLEREHGELVALAQEARHAMRLESRQSLAWEEKRALAVIAVRPDLAAQAALRQREHADQADVLRHEADAWDGIARQYAEVVCRLGAEGGARASAGESPQPAPAPGHERARSQV